MILNGTTVTGNRADLGGGIDNYGTGGRLEVRGGGVVGGNGGAGNSARSGGGIYNENATAVLATGTKVTGNSLTRSSGLAGGIANDSGTVALANTKIVTGNLPSNCGGTPAVAKCIEPG